MPQPGYPGGNPGFMNKLIQTHVTQTHATELTGAAARGLFIPGLVVITNGIFGEADAATDWEIRLVLPHPDGSSPPSEFALDTRTGSTFIANNDNWLIPVGASIKVISGATTNPRATLITKLRQEGL